jgi:hypothetical protein
MDDLWGMEGRGLRRDRFLGLSRDPMLLELMRDGLCHDSRVRRMVGST